jgi:AcrR family transcriptional regulator
MMRVMQTDTDVAPRLRRDAQRNRQLLIDAATEVLREQGMDASLDEIARRAGVGNATLYRRFPTREDLYEAVFANMGGMVGEAATRAHLVDDPWTAFATYIEEITQFCAADRGLSDLMMAGMAKSPALNAVRLESERVLQDLLDRAQRQGAIRPDIYLEDVTLMLCAMHRVTPAAETVAPGTWRRHLAIALDGFRHTGSTTELTAPPMTPDQMFRLAEQFQPPKGPDRSAAGHREHP